MEEETKEETKEANACQSRVNQIYTSFSTLTFGRVAFCLPDLHGASYRLDTQLVILANCGQCGEPECGWIKCKL